MKNMTTKKTAGKDPQPAPGAVTGWKYERGYKGRKVVLASSVTPKTLKTDANFIRGFLALNEASHFRANDQKGKAASKKGRGMADRVRKLLEGAGWHTHIYPGGSGSGCQCSRDLYLHDALHAIAVHQVPFSEERNILLLETELYEEDKVRPAKDALTLLKSRIGEETIDLNPDAYDPKTVKIIRAIMEQEGLTEVHNIDEERREFRSGAKSYTWRESEEKAESEAREYLTEEPEEWKMAVEGGHTTEGLEEWVDTVMDGDGWAHILCHYDGCYNELDGDDDINGVVYWRTN